MEELIRLDEPVIKQVQAIISYYSERVQNDKFCIFFAMITLISVGICTLSCHEDSCVMEFTEGEESECWRKPRQRMMYLNISGYMYFLI